MRIPSASRSGVTRTSTIARRALWRPTAYSLAAEKCLTIRSAYHCGHGVSAFAAA